MAGPLDLRGTVTIIDKATGPLGRIQKSIGAIGNLGKSAANAGKRLGGLSSGVAGFGAAWAGWSFLKRQYEFESALNETQAVLDTTGEKFKPLRDEIIRLAEVYPALRKEIALGAADLARAGLDIETIKKTLEMAIQGSMASGEDINYVADGVINAMYAMGIQMDTADKKAAAFAMTNDHLTAAANAYTATFPEMLDGLSRVAPIGSAVGLDLKMLLGLVGGLKQSGFEATSAGIALSSSILRLGAPIAPARAQLRAYGIELDKFTKSTGKFRSLGGSGLVEMLSETLNITDTDGLAEQFDAVLNDPKLAASATDMAERLNEVITSALGIAAGDAQDRAKIGQVTSDFVRAGFSQIDVVGMLKEMADQGLDANMVFMNAVFGKHHAPKMAKLMQLMRSGMFDALYDEFNKKIPGATERYSEIMQQGFVGATNRMASQWDVFLDKLAESGVIDTVTEAIGLLTKGVKKMGESNPTLLKVSTLGVLAAGALGTVGFAIAGIVAGGAALYAAAPFVAIGAAIAAVGYTAYSFATDWEGSVKKVKLQWAMMKIAAWDLASHIATTIGNAASTAWSKFSSFGAIALQTVWATIKATFQSGVDGLKSVLDSFAAWFETTWVGRIVGALSGLVGQAQALWAQIRGIFSQGIDVPSIGSGGAGDIRGPRRGIGNGTFAPPVVKPQSLLQGGGATGSGTSVPSVASYAQLDITVTDQGTKTKYSESGTPAFKKVALRTGPSMRSSTA